MRRLWNAWWEFVYAGMFVAGMGGSLFFLAMADYVDGGPGRLVLLVAAAVAFIFGLIGHSLEKRVKAMNNARMTYDRTSKL